MKNNSARSALQQYSAVGIHSGLEHASPQRLIQMLMQGALARIAAAKGHMKRGAIPEKGKQISLAISIIDGLRASLDHERGGEIAQNLHALYEYMETRLLVANIHNDPDILDEVGRLMQEIDAGWSELPADGSPASEMPAQCNSVSSEGVRGL